MNYTANSCKATDFHRDLAASIDAESHPAVLAAIKRLFPHSLAVHRAHPENDMLGVDSWIEQKFGVMTAVDFKIRSVDYGARRGKPMDAALEISYGSSYGWATKIGATPTDEYLFVCTDTGRAATFNAADLRTVTMQHLDEWKSKYKVLTTRTAAQYGGKAIESVAIAVPVDVLASAIRLIGGR